MPANGVARATGQPKWCAPRTTAGRSERCRSPRSSTPSRQSVARCREKCVAADPGARADAVLLQAAALADERAEAIAQTISAEAGKAITEARGEASRSGELIRLAAFEGTQLYGDSLPLDANPGTGFDKVGFTVRQPVGVVVAITPFNYPSLLVLHKVAPALAAGNAVVLKPARTTPLTALALAECFVDAGLPEGVLSVLTGPGGELGDALVSDPRVNKISFTGSTATGTRITQLAGVKKLSLELGASCPVVVLPDADIDAAAAAVALGGFVNAGQVCISVQRVITHPKIAGDFLDALVPAGAEDQHRGPGSADTGMGTLITQQEAERVERSIQRGGADRGHAADRRGTGRRDHLPGRGLGCRPRIAVQPGRAVRARRWRCRRQRTGSPRSRRPTAPPTGWAPGSSPPTSRVRCGRSGRSTPAPSTSTGPRCGGPT